MHRGEIYLVDLRNPVGSEQSGVRPAVKNMGATHVTLSPDDCGILKESTVLCEQVRVIDKSRIRNKVGEIRNKEKIEAINQKLLISIGII